MLPLYNLPVAIFITFLPSQIKAFVFITSYKIAKNCQNFGRNIALKCGNESHLADKQQSLTNLLAIF